MKIFCGLMVLLIFCLAGQPTSAKTVHHYVFFDMDHERIRDSSFLETKAFEGAQLKYTWKELEPEKDHYEFSSIRKDLAFLSANGKKLFVQLQDSSFSAKRILVPAYLQTAEYHGGVSAEYKVVNGDEEHPIIEGWAARRWDPAVQERFRKLLLALGKEFDGKVAGINLPETSIGVRDAKQKPEGYSDETYLKAVITNMQTLKLAFPKSVVIQYANFMPGEWLPDTYLRTVYQKAKELGVGVGGPDLLPFVRGQNNHSYPLIRAAAGAVATGVAVQDGNYDDVNPKTGQRATVAELFAFAEDQLLVDYIFWCTEEPFYSKEVIPFVRESH